MNALPSMREWRARLELRFQASGRRTILVHRRHEGPLLVQRLFQPEEAGGACHAYIVHPPGGVVSGDALTLEADVQPGGRALLTTPAAGKFYRKGPAPLASLRQDLKADGASLEWLPQENIFYPDAHASVSTRVHLQGGARFIGWEVACLGLPANQRSLQEGRVRLSFELWRDRRVRLIENLKLESENCEGRFGLAGLPVLGTLIASPAMESELAQARRSLSDCAEPMVACTLIDGILVCRSIARDAGSLRSRFEHLWRALRPPVIGLAPVAPRIWAT